jgi:hypothetical protein
LGIYRDLFLPLARDALSFVHDSQQVAAPKFCDLLFVIAAAD